MACKHIPVAMNTQATIEEWCFLCGQCQDVITTTAGAMSSVDSSAVPYLPAGNDASTETEESPLL
jgi:hypothetical protein